MRRQFLVVLTLFAAIACMAQLPNVAKVSHRSTSGSEDPISIATLKRIKLQLGEKHEVQSVFVFSDETEMTFENVAVITFLFEEGVAQVEERTDVTTGSETLSAASVSLYPNPATEVVNISGMTEQSKGEVISIDGQRVCEISAQTTSIDVSGWANGIYLIKIDKDIFKLIKQ